MLIYFFSDDGQTRSSVFNRLFHACHWNVLLARIREWILHQKRGRRCLRISTSFVFDVLVFTRIFPWPRFQSNIGSRGRLLKSPLDTNIFLSNKFIFSNSLFLKQPISMSMWPYVNPLPFKGNISWTAPPRRQTSIR